MPKAKSEGTKKHGDTLEPLIERAGNRSARESHDAADEDPTLLQDDDDEDVQNDDADDRRDVGERD